MKLTNKISYIFVFLCAILYGLGILFPYDFPFSSLIAWFGFYYICFNNKEKSYLFFLKISLLFAYPSLIIGYYNLFDSIEYFTEESYLLLFKVLALLVYPLIIHPFYLFFGLILGYGFKNNYNALIISFFIVLLHTTTSFQIYSNPITSAVNFIEYFSLLPYIYRFGYLFLFSFLFIIIIRNEFRNLWYLSCILIFLILNTIALNRQKEIVLNKEFNLIQPNKNNDIELDPKWLDSFISKDVGVINLLPEGGAGTNINFFINYPNLIGGYVERNENSEDKNFRQVSNNVVFSKNEKQFIQHYLKENLLIFGETTYFFDKILNKLIGMRFLKSGKNTKRVFEFNNLHIEPLICSEAFHPLYYFRKQKSDIAIVFASTNWARHSSYILTFAYETRWIAREKNIPLIFINNGGNSIGVNNLGEIKYYLPWQFRGAKKIKF